MKIKDKIKLDKAGLEKYGPITIVAFGDSVTHGALGPGEISYETVYWNLLKQKINAVRNYVPVNVINAGIGGITAKGSLGRIESQVLKHEPDLVIICFGLNDVNGSLEDYIEPLRAMFLRCRAAGVDVIFMTPNMLNTSVAPDTPEQYYTYAIKTAEMQNSGRMDEYISAAVALAKEMGIPVCDCYEKWKALSKEQDITLLLANRINHPTPEMHQLFADALYETIIGEDKSDTPDSSTMFSS